MSTRLSERRDAIMQHLSATFPVTLGYGSFGVALSRERKGEPRRIVISWAVYPFEAQVAEMLGDLMGDDVRFNRIQMWSCGIRHADAMEAWKAHEGNHWLAYPDDGCGQCDYDAEMYLPEDVEEELRASGEDFTSACVPGNYIPCPTCGGGARYMPGLRTITKTRSLTELAYEPCPDCMILGTDRQDFPGLLDLANPEHLASYEDMLAGWAEQEAAKNARQEAKRAKALAQPAATATPRWLPLPSRAAGVLNGIPVPDVAPGCDYLNHAGDPERRLRCRNDATHFDPTTGLRVCTRHTKGRLP